MTLARHPDRGECKRKWRVSRDSPLTLAGDLILKKLRQHSWPCDGEVEDGAYRFKPAKGRRFTGGFQRALAIAARIIAAEHRFQHYIEGEAFYLDGCYYINKAGKIRRYKDDCPF
jgi:hypothetical protein